MYLFYFLARFTEILALLLVIVHSIRPFKCLIVKLSVCYDSFIQYSTVLVFVTSF